MPNEQSASAEATLPSRVRLCALQPEKVVQGIFRIGRSFERLSQRNDPYRVVELVDVTGAVRCYGWIAPIVHGGPLPEWSLVEAVFRTYRYDGRVAGRLTALAPVTEPTALDHLGTLPAAICPVPGVLERLQQVAASITTSVLQDFVARVFQDPGLARGFFRVPASFVDHHAWPGGVAEHSVEMAINAARIEGLSALERDLAIVLTLFHDVGKVETHDKSSRSFETFKTIPHDALTLYLLAEPLRWLERQWPDGALAIRIGLVVAGQGDRLQEKVVDPGAEVLRGMDRISRALAMHRIHHPNPGGLVLLSQRRVLWSPSLPGQLGGTGAS